MGARLGQHFLNNPWAAHKMLDALALQPDEQVLEIGPGTGALTRELLARGARVLAIEKDEHLVEELRRSFAREIADERLRVVGLDVRDLDPAEMSLTAGAYTLAANIPYYITGEIIRQFLTIDAQPRRIALLIQKEVASRIVDTNGSLLSISVKVYGKPKVIAKVSRGHFSPPPAVDSAVILIDDISRDFFKDISEDNFFSVLRAGFSSKRKFLANNLSPIFGKERIADVFAACGIAASARAEELSREDWKRLAKEAERIRTQA